MDKMHQYNDRQVGFRIREFCQYTGLGRSTVYKLLKAGEIKSVKVYSRVIITTTPTEFISRLSANDDTSVAVAAVS